MRSRMICYVAGIFIALHQSTLIPLSGCTFIALLVLGLSLWRPRYSGLMIAGICGLLWASLWGHWQLTQRMPAGLGKTDWQLTGTVVGLPDHGESVIRFNLRIDEAHLLRGSSEFIPGQVRLSWYQSDTSLTPGQKLELIARLRPPHGNLNPQGFDYEYWLLERGIDATGYVRQMQTLGEITEAWPDRWRQQLNQQLNDRFGEGRVSALLQALSTGHKQAMTDTDWQYLRQSGTLHLAVISGLHIGFMALLGWYAGRLICLFPGLGQWRSIPVTVALVLAGTYMLLAGAGLPIQRAYLMLAVLLLSGWRLWHVDHWSRWWLAMAVVLTLSPLAIFSVGFWLSFSVVALLIWFSQLQRAGFKLIRMQLLLMPAMLPMYLLFFAGFSLLAPLINLVAIPLVSLLLVIMLADQLLYLCGQNLLVPAVIWLVECFWWLVETVSNLPWNYWYLPVPGWSELLLGLLGVALLLLPSGLWFRGLGLLMLLPLLLPRSGTAAEGEFQALVFDVGQGLAVWVGSGSYNLLYDLGPAYRTGDNAFNRNLMPFLRAKGISQIDTLVLSHDDTDHTGGYPALAQQYVLPQVFASYPLSSREAQHCRPGQQWQVNGVRFRFLSGSEGASDNERSCVLLVDNGYCSLLLTGDIGMATELRLKTPEKPLTWLLAAHHGSRFSSGDEFLRLWQPATVIYSAGFTNPFHHPHPDVRQRVGQIDAVQYSTATSGAVSLTATADGSCTDTGFRQLEPRFWR